MKPFTAACEITKFSLTLFNLDQNLIQNEPFDKGAGGDQANAKNNENNKNSIASLREQ